MIPVVGYGNIDWKNFAELVKKSGFDGILMIEAIENIKESVQRLKSLF